MLSILVCPRFGGYPLILEPGGSSKEHRKNWASLMQKIHDLDPLSYAKCQGKMQIIAFVEDEEVITKILKHLSIWEIKARQPLKVTGPLRTPAHLIDYSTSQVPTSDKRLYVNPEYTEAHPPLYANCGEDKEEGYAFFPLFLRPIPEKPAPIITFNHLCSSAYYGLILTEDE